MPAPYYDILVIQGFPNTKLVFHSKRSRYWAANRLTRTALKDGCMSLPSDDVEDMLEEFRKDCLIVNVV